MPSKSPEQHRLMEAAAHTPGGYGGVPQKVGKEFVRADQSGQDSALRGAGIMYVAGNLILLGKRVSGDMPGTWDFPGGKSEDMESPIETALRESREEIGTAPIPEGPNSLIQIDYSDDGYIAFTTFLHRTKPFQLEMNEVEHNEFRWCDVNQLPEPLHPAVALTIEKFKYFGGKMSREMGAMDAKEDGNGWVEYENNPISKVGVFQYMGKNVDPSFAPDEIVNVLRPEEELSDPECIDSFKLVPWIDEHVMLGAPGNGLVPAELKGIEGVIGERVYFENGTLYANIKVFSNNMDGQIDAGKRELSAGYRCRYEKSSGIWNGQRYDAIQRRIRGNHLALVKAGRMGPDVSVQDHLNFTFDAKDENMASPEEKKVMDALEDIKKVGDSMAAGIKALDERMAAIDKRVGDMEEKEKTGEDADEDENKMAEKKAEDEKMDKAMDARISSAMDAALAPLKKTMEAFTAGMSAQTAAADTQAAQKLSTQLSAHGFAVDGAETMALPALREAAVKKIGITCPTGQEQIALDGFFHGRNAPLDEVGYAVDSALSQTSTGKNKAEEFFQTKAA